METHEYNAQDVCVYQDNQSAILLETNSMKSVGRNLRHIKMRYFLITKKVKDKEMTIIYLPTKEMISYFFNKSLRGMLFITHKDVIL